MNSDDISYLMNMLSKMDKSQLSEGLKRVNQILSPEEKKKLIDTLNSKNK